MNLPPGRPSRPGFFYQASDALRIARNGWVSRLDRMGLVAHAMALLARPADRDAFKDMHDLVPTGLRRQS